MKLKLTLILTFISLAYCNAQIHEVYYKMGRENANKLKHSAAIADFTRAIMLKPDYTDAYIARGISEDFL